MVRVIPTFSATFSVLICSFKLLKFLSCLFEKLHSVVQGRFFLMIIVYGGASHYGEAELLLH